MIDHNEQCCIQGISYDHCLDVAAYRRAIDWYLVEIIAAKIIQDIEALTESLKDDVSITRIEETMKRYPNNGYNSFEAIGDSIVVLGDYNTMGLIEYIYSVNLITADGITPKEITVHADNDKQAGTLAWSQIKQYNACTSNFMLVSRDGIKIDDVLAAVESKRIYA